MADCKTATHLLPAVDELVSTFLGEVLLAQELLAAREMVVRGVFVLLGDAIREAVAHVSDLVHDAAFLGFGVVAIAEVVDVST
jgi:hypothetical protein